MHCLLDTKILIYLDLDPSRLTKSAQSAILDPSHELYVSLASIWELQLKLAKGKITLSRPLEALVADQCHTNGIQILGIEPRHVYHLAKLPFYHSDPFDRIISAQAMVEKMSVITSDSEFSQYGAQVLWS